MSRLTSHDDGATASTTPAVDSVAPAADDATALIPAVRTDAPPSSASVAEAPVTAGSPTQTFAAVTGSDQPTQVLSSATPIEAEPHQDAPDAEQWTPPDHDRNPVHNAGLAALVAGHNWPGEPARPDRSEDTSDAPGSSPTDGLGTDTRSDTDTHSDADTHSDTDGGPAPASRRNTALMLVAALVVWILALLVGFACAVVAGDRRASLCSRTSKTFGCTTTGSTLGIVMLVITVVVVGTASIYAFDARSQPRRWGTVLGIGFAVLALLGSGAYLMIRTIK